MKIFTQIKKLPFKILALLLLPSLAMAQMESPNYRMERDSVNVGGGESTSTNYGLNDTTGEVATGDSNSGSYMMRAGFQQMSGSYLAVSVQPVVNMPPLSLSTKESEAQTDIHVVTDNYAGYSINVRSLTEPTMISQQGYSFEDYEPVASNPDYNFLIDPNSSHFGFSAYGDDVTAKFKNDGSSCGQGSNITLGKCWDGFSTTTKSIVEGLSSNHPGGATTTMVFKAGVGANMNQPSGQYSPEIVMTVIAL